MKDACTGVDKLFTKVTTSIIDGKKTLAFLVVLSA
jgi:hypothetical protein